MNKKDFLNTEPQPKVGVTIDLLLKISMEAVNQYYQTLIRTMNRVKALQEATEYANYSANTCGLSEEELSLICDKLIDINKVYE